MALSTPSTVAIISRHPKTRIQPKRRRGRPPGTPNPIPPTPETLAKLQTSFLHSLTEDQQRAASKIDFAFQALCMRQLMRAGVLEPRIAGAKGEWGDRTTALLDAYGVWLDVMERAHLPTEWVMAMIVDGMPPGEADWRSH